MDKLILNMIEDNEFVKSKQVKGNKSKNYNGNLADLRKKRAKMLLKKHRLSLEIKQYNKMTSAAREGIFKNIEELSKSIDYVSKEIIKIQLAMKNNEQWMDGDFNL